MLAREIKDLCIALEALSRVQGTEGHFGRISMCLGERISQMETGDLQKYTSRQKAVDNDEIPF